MDEEEYWQLAKAATRTAQALGSLGFRGSRLWSFRYFRISLNPKPLNPGA